MIGIYRWTVAALGVVAMVLVVLVATRADAHAATNECGISWLPEGVSCTLDHDDRRDQHSGPEGGRDGGGRSGGGGSDGGGSDGGDDGNNGHGDDDGPDPSNPGQGGGKGKGGGHGGGHGGGKGHK